MFSLPTIFVCETVLRNAVFTSPPWAVCVARVCRLFFLPHDLLRSWTQNARQLTAPSSTLVMMARYSQRDSWRKTQPSIEIPEPSPYLAGDLTAL